MNGENTIPSTRETDITVELTRLVEAGWDEAQIAMFARRRATYGLSPEDPEAVPAKVSVAEKNRMEFARWLVQNGRLHG